MNILFMCFLIACCAYQVSTERELAYCYVPVEGADFDKFQ